MKILSFLALLSASVVATVIHDQLTEHGVITKRGYTYDNCGRCVYVPDKVDAPKPLSKEKPQKPREPDPMNPPVKLPEVDPSGNKKGGKSTGGRGGGGGGGLGWRWRWRWRKRCKPSRKTPSAG
jgi:hypothetical protein